MRQRSMLAFAQAATNLSRTLQLNELYAETKQFSREILGAARELGDPENYMYAAVRLVEASMDDPAATRAEILPCLHAVMPRRGRTVIGARPSDLGTGFYPRRADRGRGAHRGRDPDGESCLRSNTSADSQRDQSAPEGAPVSGHQGLARLPLSARLGSARLF